MTPGKKLTIEAVQQEFETAGCLLLTSEYTGNKQKLQFQCACGNEGEKTLVHFRRGPHCKACGYKVTGTKNGRLSLNDARAAFAESGCTLLATEYSSRDTLMPYLCKCGTLHNMSLANFSKGRHCLNCHNKKRWDIDKAKIIFEDGGCTLLSEYYLNTNTAMRYICSCGKESSTSLTNYISGVRCRSCGIQKISGENNYLYDASKTQKERDTKRQYTEYSTWRKKVYERDDYTCKCCGIKGASLNAHHLESYAHNPNLRTELDNGVTLCKKCHREFHMQYGFRSPVTKKQFIEYMEKQNA
jgi:5-methylcytosine-specific restriction endonuclease McrA